MERTVLIVFLLQLLISYCSGSGYGDEGGGCPPHWTHEHTTRLCLLAVGKAGRYDEAVEACRDLQADLALPTSQVMNDAMKRERHTGETWLDMSFNGANWVQADGQPVPWMNWGPGEPFYYTAGLVTCAFMSGDGKWATLPCQGTPLGNSMAPLGFFCAKEKQGFSSEAISFIQDPDLAVPPPPGLLATPSSPVVRCGTHLTFLCVTSSPGASFTFQFLKDDVIIHSGSEVSLSLTFTSSSDSGIYSCRVDIDGTLSPPSPGHEVIVAGSSGPRRKVYRDLHKQVMADASLALPMTNVERPVNVKLRLALRQILEVDADSNVVTLVLRKEETWHDPTLAWDQDVYNVTSLGVRAAKMWYPDTLPYTLVSRVDRLSPPLIVLYSTGRLVSVQMLKLSVDCDTTGYDTYSGAVCYLDWGSWNYHGTLLSFVDPSENSLCLRDFSKTSQFELSRVSPTVQQPGDCCVDRPFPSLTFSFGFRLKGWRRGSQRS